MIKNSRKEKMLGMLIAHIDSLLERALSDDKTANLELETLLDSILDNSNLTENKHVQVKLEHINNGNTSTDKLRFFTDTLVSKINEEPNLISANALRLIHQLISGNKFPKEKLSDIIELMIKLKDDFYCGDICIDALSTLTRRGELGSHNEEVRSNLIEKKDEWAFLIINENNPVLKNLNIAVDFFTMQMQMKFSASSSTPPCQPPMATTSTNPHTNAYNSLQHNINTPNVTLPESVKAELSKTERAGHDNKTNNMTYHIR